MKKDNNNLNPKHDAFQYQTDAVDKLKDLDYGAIFHEQGLGKSKIALDLILYWLKNQMIDRVIFVVKKSLINNWKKELDIHTFLDCRIIGTNPVDNRKAFITKCNVIIAHYESIIFENKRIKSFIKDSRVAMILDESTKIKNPDAKISTIFYELAPDLKKRFILTGTPVANRPYDIWSQIYFLDHGRSLGRDFRSFKKTYDLDNKMSLGDNRDAQNSVAECRSLFGVNRQELFTTSLLNLKASISNFSVRENKDSVHIDLPDKIIKNINCDWESRQHELYHRYRSELTTIVTKNNIQIDDGTNQILKKLLRFVQIASNPCLVDERYTAIPGKEIALQKLIDEINASDEKFIVWSNFIETTRKLYKLYKHLKPARIDGKMDMDQRQLNVDKFMDDNKCRALFATIGAAKEGLTLTAANHSIFFDRTFSLDDYLQAQDRIHRISQEKTCYIYNLMMRDSIDDWIESLLASKRRAAQLAQGDINIDEYQSEEDFSYGQILQRVLYD